MTALKRVHMYGMRFQKHQYNPKYSLPEFAAKAKIVSFQLCMNPSSYKTGRVYRHE